MSAAVAGAVFDERLRAGFTTWRTACRAAGFSLWPVIDFTLQLLPHAVYGLLLGGLALLVYGATNSGDGHGARCLAAHAGCALSLPVMLLLCAAAVPAALLITLDLGLAALVALALVRITSRRATVHP